MSTYVELKSSPSYKFFSGFILKFNGIVCSVVDKRVPNEVAVLILSILISTILVFQRFP
jgi:hypothetical protein